MSIRHLRRSALLCGLGAVTAGVVGIGAQPTTAAAPTYLDPATLDRGENPSILHMVRNTIRDGDRRVSAPRSREYDALWRAGHGYVVKDRRRTARLVFVNRQSESRVLARDVRTQDVSGNGRRIAWTVEVGRYDGPPTVVRVADPVTGRVLAKRTFRKGVGVVEVTPSRVLLTRLHTSVKGTTWWNFERDTLRRLSDESAVDVDLKHDRIVFDIPRDAPACNRVAVLSDLERTLWRSCRFYPHQWSPDGRHVVATHTYFDETGTDRWWTRDGLTGERVGRVLGRLDWDAAWEDDTHFLTLVQGGGSDTAAIIRCTLGGDCERASRLWHVPYDGYPPFYSPPPVVLASP